MKKQRIDKSDFLNWASVESASDNNNAKTNPEKVSFQDSSRLEWQRNKNN